MQSFDPNIVFFAYDFPHYKSENLLQNCIENNLKVNLVIAAPKKDLSTGEEIESQKSEKLRSLSNRNNINFVRIDHLKTDKITSLIRKLNCNLGIIGGARKLLPDLVNSTKFGIINYHPGMLPETAGLNAFERSIKLNIPLKVTAHIINAKLDEGLLLRDLSIPICTKDSIADLKKKSIKNQFYLNQIIVKEYSQGKITPKPINRIKYNKKMTEKELESLRKEFENWKKNFIQ